MPTSVAAQAFGGEWLSNASRLAMKVLSPIVTEESKVIINPQHPDYANVELSVVPAFTFDNHMFT